MPETPITCELCGRFDVTMEDPTWDKRYTPAPLHVCDLCAKERIENDMYKVVN